MTSSSENDSAPLHETLPTDDTIPQDSFNETIDDDNDDIIFMSDIIYRPAPPPRFVVSMDVGYRNFAIAIFDIVRQEVVVWENFDLGITKFTSSNILEAFESLFEERIAPVVAQAGISTTLIEVQAHRPTTYRVAMVDCTIRGFLGGRRIPVRAIRPADVKRHFGFPIRQVHAARKADSIRRVREFLDGAPGGLRVPEDVRQSFDRSRKKDDLADAYLQLLYFIGQPAF
jgi:hypothetical protein